MPRLPSDQDPDPAKPPGDTPQVAGQEADRAQTNPLGIERTPTVGSSHLASVGYDKDTGTLVVEFKDGEIYAYDYVPAHVVMDFLTTKSAGKYFADKIRDRYDYKQVR